VAVAEEGMHDGTNKTGQGDGEWQDLEDYQREQSIEVGNVGGGDASRAVDLGGDSEVEVQAAGDDSEVDVQAPKAKKVKTKHESANKVSKSIDKDARKMEKKARLMEEKKQRAVQKLKKAEA